MHAKQGPDHLTPVQNPLAVEGEFHDRTCHIQPGPHCDLLGSRARPGIGLHPHQGARAIVPQERSSEPERGLITVFRTFSRFLDALEKIPERLQVLSARVNDLVQAQQALGPATDRLEALELSRHHFEAQCEGLLEKAEGKLRAANNAEARERANKRSYEHLLDPFPEDGVEPETPARDPDSGNDAAPGAAQGVQPVHLGVAPSVKTLAQRAKFGVR